MVLIAEGSLGAGPASAGWRHGTSVLGGRPLSHRATVTAIRVRSDYRWQKRLCAQSSRQRSRSRLPLSARCHTLKDVKI